MAGVLLVLLHLWGCANKATLQAAWYTVPGKETVGVPGLCPEEAKTTSLPQLAGRGAGS